MGIENNMLLLAENDKEVSELILKTTNDELKQNIAAYHTQQAVEKIIKHLLIEARGFAGIEHNIYKLTQEADSEKILIPEWVKDGDYELSSWATTIRYNSNFKTERTKIEEYNNNIDQWLVDLK